MRFVRGANPARQNQLFWGSFLLLVAVSAVAVWSIHRLVDAQETSARSHNTLLELDRYLSTFKDIETGARGYAFTRDTQFLAPFDSGRADAGKRLAALKRLAPSSPESAARLRSLESLGAERLKHAEQVVALVRDGGDKEAVMRATFAGKASMDELRSAVSATSRAQQSIYEEHRRAVGRQAVVASVALALGVALSLLILAAIFNVLKKQIKQRVAAEDDLRALNADLEQRVLARTTELEEARRTLDAVIENIPDTVFLKDPRNDYAYVLLNRAGEELTGHSREDLIGHVDNELFPQDIAVIRRTEDKRVVKTGEPIHVTERILPSPRGNRVVEIRKMPLALDGTSNTYILGIVRDLTDKKALESQIREMQRLESVGRLTGGIAHDFNNLLAIIMGSVEMIRMELPDGSDSAAIADEALGAVARGAELVRRLLAFARKQHLEPTAVDLNERLPAIVPLLQRTLGEYVRVQVKLANELWLAHIDATQVDDAVVNLAINARDAMPEGGSLTIETGNVLLDADYAAHHAEVEPGEYVMLAVSDTGTGMDSETAAHAFEPFYTTKAEGEGTGLGLSQVFGWVKQSGGHIKIYSEVGHGTTIKLYLPRVTADGSPILESKLHEPVSTGHETILLVEDNSNVRRTVVRQLTQLGYTPVEAENGDGALKMIRDGVAFDLLLTDVVMPGSINGYELAAEVEKLRPGSRVLFTSGYTELAEDCRDASRKAPLLSKPYSRQDLGRAIRAALEGAA